MSLTITVESIQLHRRLAGQDTGRELRAVRCKAPITSPKRTSSSPSKQSDLSSLCTGSANLFLGTTDGFVHIVTQGFRVARSFKAHDTGSITHMKQIDGTFLLVTVSEDLSNEPVLKVWALNTEKKGGGPQCLSTVSVQNARRQFPVRENHS
jgi:hypothetical protein